MGGGWGGGGGRVVERGIEAVCWGAWEGGGGVESRKNLRKEVKLMTFPRDLHDKPRLPIVKRLFLNLEDFP